MLQKGPELIVLTRTWSLDFSLHETIYHQTSQFCLAAGTYFEAGSALIDNTTHIIYLVALIFKWHADCAKRLPEEIYYL
jgi:hypothetical protein